MEAQEVFNISAKHLLTQNKQSLGSQFDDESDEQCLYRTKDGLMCAAGPLIPDNLYEKSFEGQTIDVLMHNRPHIKNHIGEHNKKLLTDLQTCHDGHRVEDWREQLSFIAKNHNLNTEVLLPFLEGK